MVGLTALQMFASIVFKGGRIDIRFGIKNSYWYILTIKKESQETAAIQGPKNVQLLKWFSWSLIIIKCNYVIVFWIQVSGVV